MMITSSDYEFLDVDGAETSYVKLTGDSEWKGIVVQYHDLKFSINESEDQAHLEFNYDLIESPFDDDSELKGDVEFNNYLGQVLEHLISDALDKGEYRIGTKDSNDDTQKSDQQ